jgi:ABC-type antimicrobial peptide transport system permease subunit
MTVVVVAGAVVVVAAAAVVGAAVVVGAVVVAGVTAVVVAFVFDELAQPATKSAATVTPIFQPDFRCIVPMLPHPTLPRTSIECS